MGKSGPYVSTVSVSEKCLLLLFKCTRNRYECNFSHEVTSPTSRIHSEVHIFVRFWKFKYSRLQGHVTSRWFGGRQNFNLGWQKWWQRHIRFLIMVQLTQNLSFGRTKHKFSWNVACSTWRMSLNMSVNNAFWVCHLGYVRPFVQVWPRSWRCPPNFGSYWVNLNSHLNSHVVKLRWKKLIQSLMTLQINYERGNFLKSYKRMVEHHNGLSEISDIKY